MASYNVCDKCEGRVRPSRLRNVLEFIVSPLFLPFRCRVCDRRQFKFRLGGDVSVDEPDDNEPVVKTHKSKPGVKKTASSPKQAAAQSKTSAPAPTTGDEKSAQSEVAN